MSDEFKIKVQWLPGAILPVLTRRSSTASELSDLLQFSCFENEKVYLFHNGEVLNPCMTLESQGVRMSDIVECKIVSQTDNLPEDQSFAREKARVMDMQTDDAYNSREIEEVDSSSDSDYYQFLMTEENDLTASNDISTEPLPIMWQSETINYYNDENKTLIQNNHQGASTSKNEMKESFSW